MCLVRECWTGLHEMAMAAFESQYIEKYTYSASAKDIEVQSCFFDDQLINLSPPRNCMPPDVLLRESRQPALSESEKAVSSKPVSFEYQSPMLMVSLRIKGYIDTKPNHELIHYCLRNPPYKFKWNDKVVSVTKGGTETTTERYMENYKNVLQDIRDQLNAEAEAVQIILTWIYNDIYSTIDACPNAFEMWKAIERLKQGESINVQDLETNLYWEFGKFTSRDGELLKSYYLRFYKMMNELIRN
nr:hypothetical protein [Tanacetum cinerariifolium]